MSMRSKAGTPSSNARSKPAALAKLTRPRLFAVVARERLFRRLDLLLAHPTAWVTGPPGSGKTTLLSSYVESRQRPTLWYQLDGGDADIATFFHYLGVAAQSLPAGREGEPLPALTPEYLPDLPGFARRFFRKLFARLPPGSLFALDDYQEVPSGSPLHAVLASALAELPESVGCVVASRTEPPGEYARLVANQAMVTLDWQDLRLTESETAAIADSRKITDPSVIAASHRRSDGWVAGLILLLGQPPTAGMYAAPVLVPTSTTLFNYFAGILANAISEETRAVLLSVAYLPSVTGRMASLLSGNVHAERLLHALHESNYFVDRRAGSEPVYYFHALFHEFLREFTDRNCAPAERIRALRQSAEALSASEDHEQAVVLYCEAGDWEKAADLVLVIAPRLLLQGRWQTVQARIAALPETEIESRPWLQYWWGASQMAIDVETARATLAGAFDRFAVRQDVAGQMLAATAVMESYLVEYGDFAALDRWIDAVERLLTSAPPFAVPGCELQVYANLVTVLAFRAPENGNLPAYAERLLALAKEEADPNQRISAAGVLAFYQSWIGNFDAAQQARAVARPLLTHSEILPMRFVVALSGLAFSAHMRADPEEHQALLARALEIIKAHGLPHLESWIRVGDCWHRLERGDCKTVAVTLARLGGALVPSRYLDMSQFHFVKGWLALLEGNLLSARQEAEASLAFAVKSGAAYGESFTLLLLAEALVELKEFAQAERCITRFRDRLGGVHGPMLEFHALLVDAYGAWGRGDGVRCAAALRAALAIGRAHEYLGTLFWYPNMMARLCRFALEHDIEAEYVRMLIERRELSPDAPFEKWPWPVKIYTLGRFEVHANGEALRFDGKVQRKPMELIKVLAASGGREVAADALIDTLWPEPSQGDGRKALDITVHRLRKLLASDDAVQVFDRQVALNPRKVWVDAWALERLLAPPNVTSPTAEVPIELLEEAAPQVLNLFRGQFLAGERDRPWQVPIRNRLAGRLQRFALRLGEHWESRQQWRRAIDLYQRVVELDPLAELFYRRQMICLEAQGRRAEAVEVYRRCRQTFSLLLGVAPNGETDAVYRRLLAT